MHCSPARLAANRINAQRSTGPRTAEGKARSRANALKHGLAGAGVALPPDEAAAVDARAARLAEELKPAGEMGRILLRRIAVQATLLDQSARHRAAMTARRVREALKARDDARRDEADNALALLPHDPDRAVQRMQATPEGIDGLIEAWQILRGRLSRPGRDEWTEKETRKVDFLLGRHPGMYPPTQFDPFLRALDGDFSGLRDDQGGDLPRKRRIDWAREQLGLLVDAEVQALRELRELVDDDEDEALDRAQAADRALADTSKEGELIRRYEVAAERGMFRALREFHDLARRAEPIEAEETPAPAPAPAPPPPPPSRAPSPPRLRAAAPAPSVAQAPPSSPRTNPTDAPVGPVAPTDTPPMLGVERFSRPI